jgi:uncharacterized protein (TIGR02588 family)
MASRTNAESIEWIAGVVSALIVVGIIGFFVYEAISGANGLPRLEVTVDPIVQTADQTHLRYLIRNEGGQAASAVTLSFSLPDGARRSVIVDYVPAHSQVTGGLYVPESVRPAELELTVDGYVDP